VAGTGQQHDRVPPLRQLTVAMRAVLLVHGAGSGPWVFDRWAQRFGDVEVETVDLQAGLVVARASMLNYAAAVVARAHLLPTPVALVGWSMGGLAALMAAERAGAERLVLLEASPPAEVQGIRHDLALEQGTFDPEEIYGAFPPGLPSRPESTLARAERARGISVPTLPCPTLVAFGDEFPDDRGRDLVRTYNAEELHVPGLDHWGLVRDEGVADAVARWLLD